MITSTESEQLLQQCNEWLQTLSNYKENITEQREILYQWAAGKNEQEIRLKIEHFHNQFHIQLINLHDQKHAIKEHIHQITHHPNFGHKIPHHALAAQHQSFIAELQKLITDFKNFIS